MKLYDIFQEIAANEVTKTTTGDSRISGIMIGTVAKNYDADMPGRICVTMPTRDQDANELKWMRMIMPSSGQKWGHYFMPEVGDQVAVLFEGGNIEKPYVMGCIAKDNNQFLSGSVTKKNEIKRIVTKHGSTILFEDSSEDEDGNKDKITISTAQKAHTILLDNENSIIRITDKGKENYMEMRTNDGQLTIKVKSKISISVGDSIQIKLNGETGTVKLEANEVSIAASKQIKAKTDGMIKWEGDQISQNASTIYKVSSSNMISFDCSNIKLG